MELLHGISVYVVEDKLIQNRKHRKRRINKKWAKRYGFTVMPAYIKDGKILQIPHGLMMNRKTYEVLKKMGSRR